VTSLSLLTLAYLSVPVLTIVVSLVTVYWITRRGDEVRGSLMLITLYVFGGIGWQVAVIANILSTARWMQRVVVFSELGFGMASAFVWLVFVARYSNIRIDERRWFRVGAVVVWYELSRFVPGVPFLEF